MHNEFTAVFERDGDWYIAYSPEIPGANGQGQNNNQYVVDGLDVTSGIRQGVLNLTPQPEAIQETSVQVNTFSSEYSRAAGLHGSARDRNSPPRYGR